MKNYKELRQNFRQSMGEELEMMHNLNDEAFECSSEGEYWKRRSQKSHKKSQSCQKFKAIRNLKKARRKKSCFGDQFKKTKKWYGYDEKYFDYDAFEYVVKENVTHFGLRNRVFCRCCNKMKFIFTSEKKADNFIHYNGEVIKKQSGYSPIRSYYCSACGGWHTTHQEKLEDEQPTFQPFQMSEDSMTYEGYEIETTGVDIHLFVENEIQNDVNDVKEEMVAQGSPSDAIINENNVSLYEAEESEKTANEDERMRLISEIENLFEGQTAEFNQALEARDLNECVRLNARLRRIFSSFDIQCDALTTILERIDAMSQQIKELEQELQQEEMKVKKEIWAIQQLFNSHMTLFTKKFILGKYEECWKIYNTLTSAISSFPKDMRFLQDFRRKLKTMEIRLCRCGLMTRATA